SRLEKRFSPSAFGMPPTLIYILIWRLSIEVLYPYNYTDADLPDTLGYGHITWSRQYRIMSEAWVMMREQVGSMLFLVCVMEIMTNLEAALNLPIARR
ncbi:hypothetical protein KR018_000966, partial [Drosophila ironensis]